MQFLYNENREVVAEKDYSGNIIRYIRGLGLISSDSENAKTYYHYVCDEQGSVSRIIRGEDKENGAAAQDKVSDRVLNHYEYDAFGNTISCEERVANRFRYQSGSKTPSEIARSWQGTGKYPGIDDYVDVTVEKGTVLYRGEPNGTEYFTTLDAIEQSGRDVTKLFEGLQVEKNPIHGYRGEMQGYIFNEDVASAYGITNANPQFGKGGLPQYYVPDVQDLIDKGILTPVDNIKLNK